MTGLLALLNLLTPVVSSVVTMIVHKDGSLSAVVYLDEADAQFAANQKQIADWFKSKQIPPTA